MARPPAAPAAPQQAPLGPGDVGGLFECLQGALQPATQKQCEAVLLGLEQRPGYSSCLLVKPQPLVRPLHATTGRDQKHLSADIPGLLSLDLNDGNAGIFSLGKAITIA
jgi:hypothetical protein